MARIKDDALAAAEAEAERWRDEFSALMATDDERSRLAFEAQQEAAAARAEVAALREVHARYFDLDSAPGFADPEPEDVWRFDRDFRAALTTGADQ